MEKVNFAYVLRYIYLYVDCDDSLNKILYLTHTDSKGLPPKDFCRSHKMPEVLADKIKHYFVNLGKDKQIMKEKRTPDEAFLSEKVAFEI